MQILNFVPEDYLQRKTVRRANLICAVLGVAIMMTVTVLLVLIGVAEDQVEAERQVVDGQVAEAADGVKAWQQLQADRKALLQRAERAAKLLDPLPRSRVVAEVVRGLPKGTVLTELSVEDEQIKIADLAKAEGDRKSRKGPAAAAVPGAKGQPAPLTDKSETKLRLTGLAPTDVEVAQVMAALSNSPYFNQVELSFSEGKAQNSRVLRRFEILCRLNKDAMRSTSQTAVSKSTKGREVKS